MAPDLTDAQLDAIAERVATDDDLAASIASQLPTGRLGGRFLLSRRQLLASAAGGATGVAALTALGVDEAEAQAAAGQVGTESEPVDVEAAALDAQSVSTDDLTISNQLSADMLTLSNDPSSPSRSVTRSDLDIGDAGRESVGLKFTADNSDTDLLTDPNASISAGLFVVSGRLKNSSARFCDILVFTFSGSANVIASSERGSVGVRTYDASGGLSVSIDDGGAMYNLVVQSLSMFLELSSDS